MESKESAIIQEYRCRPCLWDRKSKLWQRPDIKDREIEKVATAVELSSK